MKSNNEKHSPLDAFRDGAVVGSVTIMVVSPLLYLKNMMQLGKTPMLKDCLRGVGLNGLSYVPTAATVFAVNSMLLPDNASNSQMIAVAGVSGALSGMVSCMPENLVQNKQAMASNPSVATIWRAAVQNANYRALWRGGAAVMVREGIFAPGYKACMPIVSDWMQQHGVTNPLVAGALSACVVGPVIAAMTTPFDAWRAQKQQELTTTKQAPKYSTIIKNLGWRGAMRGVAPRSVAVCAALLLMQQGERYLTQSKEEDVVRKQQ